MFLKRITNVKGWKKLNAELKTAMKPNPHCKTFANVPLRIERWAR